MNQFERTLRTVCRDLVAAGVHWAFVGGLAVSVRTRPRFTQDLDIAVAVAGNSEAERVVFNLRSRGYEPLAQLERDDADRLTTVRLSPPNALRSDIITDLLFTTSGIEREVVAAAETLEVYPALRAPVARTGHLLAMKVFSVGDHRPHDYRDIGWLLSASSEDDLALARAGVQLIEARTPGKPGLADRFEQLLADYRRAPWE